MFFKVKYHKYILIIFPIILLNCQFNDPLKTHGVVFLENRSKKLLVNKSNINDVIKIIGQPHTKSINDENEWLYFERILTKGEFHKLGQNILDANNLLQLKFNKYGILTKKEFFDKSNIKKLDFSKMETNNQLSQKSFVEKFLSSIKNKMYRNR